MTHNADPDGIQRQRPSLTTEPRPSGLEPAAPSRPRSYTDLRLPGLSPLLRRLPVLAAGLALGSVFAAWVAWECGWSTWGLSDRAQVWLCVMGGPIVGTVWGMAQFHPPIMLGWVGLLLIPAHPWRPHPATACATLVGFCLWYSAGFLAFMVAVWGA